MYRRFAREDRLQPLLEQVVDAMMELTDAERGAVVVQRDPTDRMEVTRELAAGTDGFKFSRSVIDRVLRDGEPVLSVDAAHDERFDDSRSISHLNLRSVLAVPLVFRGQVLGAAYVDHRLRRGNFDEHDLAHMEDFAELAALAVAHAEALSEVRAQAEALERQGHELSAVLEAREVEVVGLREEVRSSAPTDRGAYRGIVGTSARMQQVFRLIDRLADSDVPVVIQGESGTGKELVARAIHDAGSRARGPFVAENCGAIPETLLESVLFGHAKGAFTGASRAKVGLFEAAGGGTIFLDEVGETSPSMQTKLLRVLQEGEVRRVGENAARPVDVRVIAASNRDLEAMVKTGQFRQDLYYRIHVVRLELPALRERIDDLPALVEHFLGQHDAPGTLRITPAAWRALRAHAWPGNVRELENEVQRWVALCEGAVTVDDLSLAIDPASAEGMAPDDLRIRPRVDRLERELIDRALERTEGNQTRAAALLGLSRFGLQKKLRRLAGDADAS
jgi:transcriptional regulator with GAF, ATPase, and Fis domain